jgi:hypothetical protein
MTSRSTPRRDAADARVLRIAVTVDDMECDQLHQTGPGSVSIGTSYKNDLVVFGSRAPLQHKLFDFRDGRYFIDLPPQARGKLRLGKKAVTVSALRRRAPKPDASVRLALDPRAQGKLILGDSTVWFKFTRPKVVPPRLPFPREFRPRFENYLDRRDQVALTFASLVLGSYFVYVANVEYDDSFALDDVDERFVQVMGLQEQKKDQDLAEEEEEKDELAEEDEEEPVEQEKPKPEPEKLKEKPEQFSKQAMAEARSVGVARVLGTYGGPDNGTVFDVIQSTENNLGELFAQGMTTTVMADGGDISPFVPGGEGITASGGMVNTKGFETAEGPALDKRDDKRERKVQGKTKASKTDVFGGGDAKALRATIARRTSALQHCYNQALRTQPDLAGKMTYTIAISVMGSVTKVVVEEDTLGSSSVAACTRAKIQGWRFPMNGADEAAEVTFSVVFSGS